jgi:hypothetical protein
MFDRDECRAISPDGTVLAVSALDVVQSISDRWHHATVVQSLDDVPGERAGVTLEDLFAEDDVPLEDWKYL